MIVDVMCIMYMFLSKTVFVIYIYSYKTAVFLIGKKNEHKKKRYYYF